MDFNQIKQKLLIDQAVFEYRTARKEVNAKFYFEPPSKKMTLDVMRNVLPYLDGRSMLKLFFTCKRLKEAKNPVPVLVYHQLKQLVFDFQNENIFIWLFLLSKIVEKQSLSLTQMLRGHD